MGHPDSGTEPRRGAWLAFGIFVLAALTLCWPILSGQIITGSDYQLAGWAFRHFGAEYWRQHHAIPLWNPYIFGGMPYVSAMHGDIFYPTAWLRWFLPLDLATNLTFAGHLVVAGLSMYALLRGLRASWAAAVAAGIGYELTGIVASLVHPGHDGKLFVSALAPLLLLGLLRGIRDRRISGYACAALVSGLALHGHPQLAYYLLFGAGIWTLFLVFGHPEGPVGNARWKALGWSLAAVLLGVGLYAVQLLPVAAYVPYSPRAAGGPSGGWEYATGYAMPPAELLTTFLPELNGIQDAYAGANFFKLHTEYIGAIVLLLALCGLGGKGTRRERIALLTVAGVFLLVSFGGHTPFYRVWYDVMPMMKKVRAAGSAFFMVAMPVCVLAGLGVDRIRSGEVAVRRIAIGAGVFALLGLLGALGGLDGIAQSVAAPQLVDRAAEHAPDLHAGALRMLVVALAGGAILLGVRTGRIAGAAGTFLIFLAVLGDLWSMDRKFFVFGGREADLFGGDQLTDTLNKTPLPYRILDPKGEQFGGLQAYTGSWLMGRDVPQLLGYHGNELRAFDDVMGGKNVWANQVNPVLLRLFSVRYITLVQPQQVPGYHQVMGPVTTRTGGTAVLYEADTLPAYVHLMAGALKAPEAQTAEIVSNPRCPCLDVAIYPETAAVQPTDLGGKVPAPATARARITAWEPGKMSIAIEGSDPRPLYLVVAENWYKDWEAEIDGRPAPVLKAQHTLLSVVVPTGAREVGFRYRSREYERGRLISLLSLLAVGAMLLVPVVRKRGAAHG